MYQSPEEYNPRTEEELLNLLTDKIEGKKKVAIIGGHYMLLYDRRDDELKPVIWQELENAGQKDFAEQNAGNFPVRSFRYSIELYKRLKQKKIDSGILLLVNDHKFQSEAFQPDTWKHVDKIGGKLRKKYYVKNTIPGCYAEVLEAEQITQREILIDNNNDQRQSSDILPKESWFYSEKTLRNRFDKFVKPELLAEGKIIQRQTGKFIELYFVKPNLTGEVCLTENGSCACSAEVMEFIFNLIERDFTEIIFFVPNECAQPVDNGIMATLSITDKPAKVLAVSRFGGMGFNEETKRPFKVTEHVND